MRRALPSLPAAELLALRGSRLSGQLRQLVEDERLRQAQQQAEALQSRQEEAMRQLVAKGFRVKDVEQVMPLCEGSAVRCEAVLRVAFDARL